VLHLVDRLVADLLVEPLEAPVLAHLGVDEVLVDRGELVGEQLIQERQDLFSTLHGIRDYDHARPVVRRATQELPRG
jgi:hypothetical protein